MNEIKDKRKVLLLLHGIRTRADWIENISPLFTGLGYHVQPVRYGYFDLFRFLFPFWTRSGPVKRLIEENEDNAGNEVSIIAHSFGTYVVSKALQDTNVHFNRVVFCGAIVPTSFRAAQYKNQITCMPILNDCGSRDVWPAVASAITWGYGSTGAHGFGRTGIRDRFHDLGHSDFFSPTFVEKFWVPFFRNGEIRNTARKKAPSFISMIAALPLQWLMLLFLVVGVGIFTWRQFEVEPIPFAKGENWIFAGYYREDGSSSAVEVPVKMHESAWPDRQPTIADKFKKGDQIQVEIVRRVINLDGSMTPTQYGDIEEVISELRIPKGSILTVIETDAGRSCAFRSDIGCEEWNPYAVYLKVRNPN